jgi:eukaryotic-like serine/threonine-protein kinase
MKISDSAIERLRTAAEFPDLDSTRYRLLGKLGQGGMSVVYRIEDSVLDRQVAMKVANVPDADSDLAARLLREAKIIAQLEHPGIVPVHDVGTLPDGRVYYTMKLVQGERLDEYAIRISTIPERLRLLQKICDAVAFAHAHSVLHRDLKPQNVMVGPFGEVLVMDWGLSKIVHEPERASIVSTSSQNARTPAQTTAHGAVLGTPGYMAPEQERGEVAAITERTDIFSLGAIMQFLVRDLAESGSPVPRSRVLAAIAQKATADLPAARYQSVADLSADLAAYLDGLQVQAYPEGRLGALRRWAARNRVWLLLVLAYLVMRAILILWRRP